MDGSEIVQVELVAPWWENLMPVAALAISLVSVALTLWFRYSERLRLSVKLGYAYPVGGGAWGHLQQEFVTVTVTNKSRTATTHISNLGLALDSGGTFIRMEGLPTDARLPATLEPGQSISGSYEFGSLSQSFQQNRSAAKWVRGFAICGHKVAKGKKSKTMAQSLRAGRSA